MRYGALLWVFVFAAVAGCSQTSEKAEGFDPITTFLPKTPASDTTYVAIYLSVNADKHYFIGNRQIDSSALRQELQTETAKLKKPVIKLRMDRNLPAQMMIDILDIANELKVAVVPADKKDNVRTPGH